MSSTTVTRPFAGTSAMDAEPIAWINGQILPLRDAALSVLDAGVTTGASVTERLRTFRHQPFLLDEHLARLRASADAAFVRLREPAEGLGNVFHAIVERNSKDLPAQFDLTISVFATEGMRDEPSLCIHASPIPATHYANAYTRGLSLATPPTRAVPSEILSPQIKTRSRLHWHIADRQAEQCEAGARALLVDGEGFVTETSSGNLFVVRGRKLLTPRRDRTLHGISQAYVMALASEQGFDVAEEDLSVDDVLDADEAFSTSSVYCMLPVVRLNRCGIGDGLPGKTYRALLAAWSNRVGVEIAEQMEQMAQN